MTISTPLQERNRADSDRSAESVRKAVVILSREVQALDKRIERLERRLITARPQRKA
jgi:hypothetical protein